jgi:tripartite motif-containing protein 2/3/tripartite motif-containing protein 71
VVLDSKHGLVKVFGEDLKFKHSFGGVGSNPGLFNMPQAMALDESGHIWVADTGNHRIQEFSPDGKVISVVGKPGAGAHEFRSPSGIAIYGRKVCVADNGNGRLQYVERK